MTDPVQDDYEFRTFTYDRNEKEAQRGPRKALVLNVGWRETKRIVPPAGEKYAFDLQVWARTIEAYISPTGSSIRVYVDGKEVKA